MAALSKEAQEREKQLAAYDAGAFIEDGMILGLGTGTTAYFAIMKAGELVKQGFRLTAVATSEATARLASEQGLELVAIDSVERIDLAIDGVDEIDSDFNAIKGGGAAHFREKIVATLAERVIWILDSTKVVDALGAFPLPVEILPFGYRHTMAYLEKEAMKPQLRRHSSGETKRSDNGNYICDLDLGLGFDIEKTVQILDRTVGVIEDGLFLKTCDLMIVGRGDTVERYYRS